MLAFINFEQEVHRFDDIILLEIFWVNNFA